MAARHHATRAENERLDGIVLGAFVSGTTTTRDDLLSRIGRSKIGGPQLDLTLLRLRRARKISYDRKTGWSLMSSGYDPDAPRKAKRAITRT